MMSVAPILLPPDPPKGDMLGTVWVTEDQRWHRTYFRVTHEGERQNIIIRRCDSSGRILKGARAMHRHRGSFFGICALYQRKTEAP